MRRPLISLLWLALLLVAVAVPAQQPPLSMLPFHPMDVQWSHALLRGLKEWWGGGASLSGSVTLYNRVRGATNHGTLTNMAASATSGWNASSRPGGTMQLGFDGTDDYVDTSVAAGFSPSTPFTLCAWVAATAGSGGNRTILSNPTANTYSGILFWFGENSTQPVLAILGNGASTEVKIVSTTALTLNTWYHLCATYDGSQTAGGIGLWANGVALPTTTAANSGFSAFADNPWRLGANRNTTAAEFFQGTMESVMVWTRALAASEIQALYAAGLQGDAPLFVQPLDLVSAPQGAPGSFFHFFGR